jgi:hypothetical protein
MKETRGSGLSEGSVWSHGGENRVWPDDGGAENSIKKMGDETVHRDQEAKELICSHVN